MRFNDKKISIINFDKPIKKVHLFSNIKELISHLMNSSDKNTLHFGLFLNNMVDFFGIEIDSDMTNMIFKVLKTDENGNVFYRGGMIDYFKALSNSCIINRLIECNQSPYAKSIFEKMINSTFNMDEEFNILMQLMNMSVDNFYYNMLGKVLDAYSWAYQNGKKEIVLNNVRKMIILIDMYDAEFYKTSGISYCDALNNSIYLNENIGDKYIVFHEFGHMIDNYLRIKNENYNKICKNAKKHALRYPSFEKEICELEKSILERKKEALEEYNQKIIRKYGSIDNGLLLYKKYINDTLAYKNLFDIFILYNVKKEDADNIINDYNRGCLNINKFAIMLYNIDAYNYANSCISDLPEVVITDIISAVFKNRVIGVNKRKYKLTIAHDKEYYDEHDEYAMDELMANYNVLKVMGDKLAIEKLRNIFGDEFVDFLDRMYTASPSDDKNKQRK